MRPEWEYRVEELGKTWKGVEVGELEALLNEASGEGWEPVTMTMRANSSRLLVVLRRPRRTRARDRSRTWP
ncbi:MAG: DUF4177 domain-containing protein [Anaerolineaceae bacterium]|nr:MAG: DUF4177 domain-containing protein [Anaerolineaceae bacterium]